MSSAWPHGTSRLLAFGKGGCLCISWVEKRKVFAQAFFKRLAGCGTASHGLNRLRQTQENRKIVQWTVFRKSLRFRSGRSWARATGTQDPSSGGAGARWAPFSADRAGRRDFLTPSSTAGGCHQAFLKSPLSVRSERRGISRVRCRPLQRLPPSAYAPLTLLFLPGCTGTDRKAPPYQPQVF